MKKTIWKYPLTLTDIQIVELPEGFEILDVQIQRAAPHMWVLVDPSQPLVSVDFEVYGTGHPIHYGMGTSKEYVGTWTDSGNYVWHLFKNTGI